MTYPYGNTGGPLCSIHGTPLSSVYRVVGMTTIREDYCPICAGEAAALAAYRDEPRTRGKGHES